MSCTCMYPGTTRSTDVCVVLVLVLAHILIVMVVGSKIKIICFNHSTTQPHVPTTGSTVLYIRSALGPVLQSTI